MLKRIVVTLSEQDFDAVAQQSDELGMSPSGLAKYRLLEGLGRSEQIPLPEPFQKMDSALGALEAGQTFIISGLFSPDYWRDLDLSSKRSLAKRLARIARDKSGPIEPTGETLPDRTKIYRKKKEGIS